MKRTIKKFIIDNMVNWLGLIIFIGYFFISFSISKTNPKLWLTCFIFYIISIYVSYFIAIWHIKTDKGVRFF